MHARASPDIKRLAVRRDPARLFGFRIIAQPLRFRFASPGVGDKKRFESKDYLARFTEKRMERVV
jgi:hypothetical protein